MKIARLNDEFCEVLPYNEDAHDDSESNKLWSKTSQGVIVTDKIGGLIKAHNAWALNNGDEKSLQQAKEYAEELLAYYTTQPVSLPSDIDYSVFKDSMGIDTNLGVYLYDDEVLYGFEDDMGQQTYRFTVALYHRPTKYGKNVTTEQDLEIFSKVFTCELKHYAIEVDRMVQGKKVGKKLAFDWVRLMQESDPVQYNECIERVLRKVNQIDKPFLKEGDDEYIEVDEMRSVFLIGDRYCYRIEHGKSVDLFEEEDIEFLGLSDGFVISISNEEEDGYYKEFENERDYNSELTRLRYMQELDLSKDLDGYKYY